MDPGKVVFFLLVAIVSTLALLFAKNKSRSLLVIAAFVFVFQVGWIFYHYNGIWVQDIPLLLLVGYGLFSGQRFRLFPLRAGWVFILLSVWGLLSAVGAPEPGWAVSESTKFIRSYLIFICVVNFVRSPRDLHSVLMALVSGLLMESLIAIHQWRWGHVGLTFLGERPYRWDWRSTGTFFTESFFGNYLALLIPLTYRLFVFYKPRRRWETMLHGVVFFCAIVALFSTYVRGAWISTVLVLGIGTLASVIHKKLQPRVKWALGLLVVFSVAFAVKYSPTIMSQFSRVRQYSVDIRYEQWRIAGRIIQDRPLTGTGLGNYELLSPQYVSSSERALPQGWQYSEMVHNSYLLLTAETGIPGGLLLVSWFLIALHQGWKLRRSHIPYFRNVAVGIASGFLSLALSYVYSPDIHAYPLLFEFWFLAGVLFSLQRLEVKQRFEQKLSAYRKASPLEQIQGSTLNYNGKELPNANPRYL